MILINGNIVCFGENHTNLIFQNSKLKYLGSCIAKDVPFESQSVWRRETWHSAGNWSCQLLKVNYYTTSYYPYHTKLSYPTELADIPFKT